MVSAVTGGILLLIIWLILLGLGIASFIFWILMLIDAIKRDFPKDGEKIVWILVLIFTGILGAIIYYFVVKKKE